MHPHRGKECRTEWKSTYTPDWSHHRPRGLPPTVNTLFLFTLYFLKLVIEGMFSNHIDEGQKDVFWNPVSRENTFRITWVILKEWKRHSGYGEWKRRKKEKALFLRGSVSFPEMVNIASWLWKTEPQENGKEEIDYIFKKQARGEGTSGRRQIIAFLYTGSLCVSSRADW